MSKRPTVMPEARVKWLCPSALCLVVLPTACGGHDDEEEPENLEPYAWMEIGSEAEPLTGAPIWFDATRSVDDDGTIVSYLWSFGDGDMGADAQMEHVYETAGDYFVALEVTDDTGATAQQGAWLTVGGVTTARIASETSILFGVPATFDGTGSTTTGGSGLEWYAWDMGDGAVEYGSVVTHTYAYPDEYVVTLYVEGDDDMSAQTQQVVDAYVPSFEGSWLWAAVDDGQLGPPCSAFPVEPLSIYEGGPGDAHAFFIVQGEGGGEIEYSGRLDTLDFVVVGAGELSLFTVTGTFTSPTTFTATFAEDPSTHDSCPDRAIIGTKLP